MLLHHLFIESALRHGNKKAIHDCSTGKHLSYSETLIAALLLTRKWKKLEKGFVGLMIPTSAGCILTQISILMSGRIPVMINYSTGAEQNALYAQEKCNFKTIITSKALLEKINCPHVDGMIFIEDVMETITGGQKLKALAKSKLPRAVLKRFSARGDENDTALILFTSGSEKEPKAVQLTHKNIVSNVIAASNRFGFTEDDIFLSSLPLFHVFGLTVTMWLPLYEGTTILTYANPLEYRTICEIIRDHRATCIVGTPSFFWGYLRKSEPGDFESIRIMLSGADKCPDTLRDAVFEKHGITLIEGYGATECAPVISANSPAENRPGSIGKPLPGVQVRIEDYETGEECTTGQHGRILVKGDNVMKGYYDDFEQTSLHIRHGWYDTGDIGYLDEDGYLWHVGRLKRFVKIGGEMVSLIKVESLLGSLLPGETECCVVEVPDPLKGAKIVAVTTEKIDEKTICKKLGEELPKIAIPKVFLTIEELPKMGSGKLDFRGVTEIAKTKLSAGES